MRLISLCVVIWTYLCTQAAECVNDERQHETRAERIERLELEFGLRPPSIPAEAMPDSISWGESFEGQRAACFFEKKEAVFPAGTGVQVFVLMDPFGSSVELSCLSCSTEAGVSVPLIREVGLHMVDTGLSETGCRRVLLSAIYDLSLPGEYIVQYRVPSPDYLERRRALLPEFYRQVEAGEEITIEWPPIEYGLQSQPMRFTIVEPEAD